MALYLISSIDDIRTTVQPTAVVAIDFSWETIDEATTDINSIVFGNGTIDVDLTSVGTVTALDLRNAVRDAARLASAAAGQTIAPADFEFMHHSISDIT
jgi:hypothetical protein